jgi:starch phosphorylase
MTPLALKMCRSSNGVSRKHGEVSRALWQKMYAPAHVDEVPISYVTNGVHAPTWIAPALKSLYEKHIGANWAASLEDLDGWAEKIERIPDEEIWQTHNLLKNQLIAFVRQRESQKPGVGENLFEPNVLTIGFARRVAGYKRWNLLLADAERLLRLIDDENRPVQFVFAGKAHPQDRQAKAILQQVVASRANSAWARRAVFIQDYDQEVARNLVQGVDVWLNVPRRPLEASGTSGEKVAMNGGLNFSILDGWWIEGYDGINGWAIGDEHVIDDETDVDERDANALYTTLETEIVPEFYAKDENDLPRQWIKRMRRALATLTPQFSSDRMVRDYINQIYN